MKTTAAVVDFGTNKIVTVLAQTGAFSRFEILGSGTIPYSGYQDKAWIEPDVLAAQVRQSIAAAELEAREKITEVFVSVPPEFSTVRFSDVEVPVLSERGRITEELIDEVQDKAAESLSLLSEEGGIIHRSPAWFLVDGGRKTMQPLHALRKAQSLRALTSFIIAEDAFLHTMRALFASLQIHIAGFLSPSLSEAIFYIPTEERDKTACLVDVGYLSTAISIVEGDAITYQKVLPVGGGFLTADLAENLQMDMATAERLKREFSFDPENLQKVYTVTIEGTRYDFTASVVAGAMARTIDELLDGIEDAIAQAGPALSAGARVYLTGGGLAPMHGVEEWLSDRLARTVSIAQASSTKLGGAWFASVHGQLDQVFDALLPRTAQEDTPSGKLVSGVKNLFRKENSEPNDIQ